MDAGREDSLYGERYFDDGRYACIVPLTFGRARILIGPPPPAQTYDDAF